MRLYKEGILFLLFISLVHIEISFAQKDLEINPATYIQKAENELRSKNFKSAAFHLYKGYKECIRTNVEYPALGFLFIQVVAEAKLTNFYDKATEMYYWSLSSSNIEKWKDVFEKELNRMKYLVSKEEYLRWERLLNDHSPEFLVELRKFWKTNDYLPTQKTNYRLVEHWERLAYISKNFEVDKNESNFSDDRAEIYLRYGKPTRKKAGSLDISRSKVIEYIDKLEQQIRVQRNIEFPSFANLIASYIQYYNKKPNYEIWFYDNLNKSFEAPLLFLFSTNSSKHQLISSIDDLISTEAFSKDTGDIKSNFSSPPYRLPYATIIQLLYYEQLSSIDSHFENRFLAVADFFNTNATSLNGATAFEIKSKNQSINHRKLQNAGRDKSTYRESIPTIPLELLPVRVLSDNNSPQLLVLVFSKVYDTIKFDAAKRSRYPNIQDYNLYHRLLISDQKWENTRYISSKPNISPKTYQNTDVPIHSATSFRIPYRLSNSGKNYLQIAVDLIESNSGDKIDTRFNNTIIQSKIAGIARSKIEFPEPLPTVSDQLVLSDLILGYNNSDIKITQDLNFPFLVHPERKIPYGSALNTYFEVYHLAMNEKGTADYTLSYQISEKKFFNMIKREKTDIQLTINYSIPNPMDRRYLEIDTNELAAGDYEIKVQITDLNSNRMTTRSIDFEVY